MTAIVGSSRSRARALQVLVLFSLAAWQCHAQSPALQQYCESQLLAARAGMQHIPQVNMRVSTIWQELVHYSGEVFPVYASQQCTAGQSTPYGIYLDISIASDPSIEVTRFFLAHEWCRVASPKMLPSGVVASSELLPLAACVTIPPSRPRGRYEHQNDACRAR